jgi:hypothetical protein
MRISLLDAATLLSAVVQGSKTESVGFEDADRTLSQMRLSLYREIEVEKSVVESALWSVMLLKEEGLFTHPDGMSYEAFISGLSPSGERFNPEYCVFEKKEKV